MKKILFSYLSLACFLANAQDVSLNFPSRPITIVVPSGAGGTTDILARILGGEMSKILKQSVIIDNKPGASGLIGSSIVARANPNGYTLLMSFPAHVINPSLKKDLPYNTNKDFTPIAKVGTVSAIFLVNKDVKEDNLKDFTRMAANKKNELNYGSVGVGSWGNLAMLLFQSKSGLKMTDVTYKSDPELMTALIRGDIHSAFVSPITSIPFIKSNKVKALAIADQERLATMPDVPTVSESGYKGFTATGWNAIFGPANMPKEVVDKLNYVINQALNDKALREQFIAQGVKPLGGTPEDLRELLEKDILSIGSALKSAGINPS